VLLRAVIVVPKRGRAHLGLHRLDLALFLIAVKETSIGGRRAFLCFRYGKRFREGSW
jgi:hypothetical protein